MISSEFNRDFFECESWMVPPIGSAQTDLAICLEYRVSFIPWKEAGYLIRLTWKWNRFLQCSALF